jgi:hypothetical protein
MGQHATVCIISAGLPSLILGTGCMVCLHSYFARLVLCVNRVIEMFKLTTYTRTCMDAHTHTHTLAQLVSSSTAVGSFDLIGRIQCTVLYSRGKIVLQIYMYFFKDLLTHTHTRAHTHTHSHTCGVGMATMFPLSY